MNDGKGKTKVGEFLAKVADRAQRHPDRRAQILLGAADDFEQMAADPRNARSAKQLLAIARKLQEAAAGPQHAATTDDFQEQLRETVDAYEDGGQDDMDLAARRRGIHEADGAPRVSIAPRSFGRDTALGRSVTIKWNPTAEERRLGIKEQDTVCFWQGEKHEAQAITVDVGPLSRSLVVPTDEELAPTGRPYAEVEYGTDGMRTVVRFDIGRGVRFTVLGNYVAVRVGMAAVDGFAAQMTVGVSLGTFAAPSAAPVICTVYVDSLSGGVVGEQTDFLEIPVHAVQLLPPQTNALGGTVRVDFYGYTGGGSAICTVEVPIPSVGVGPIPIPGDAGFFKVTNQTGETAKFRMPFQLSL